MSIWKRASPNHTDQTGRQGLSKLWY